MSQITTESGKKLFDLRVHIFDPKTGRIVRVQPYKKIVQKGMDPEEYYIRDGIRYLANGECLDKEKLVKQEAAAKTSAASKVEEGLL